MLDRIFGFQRGTRFEGGVAHAPSKP